MKIIKNLVVGCGLSGATIARKIAEDFNSPVVIIDERNTLGGNAYDYRDENGITVHHYGSHIFHTSREDVWKWVNRFASFNTYMHRVVALIDGIETTAPFNLRTLHRVFPLTLAKRIEEKLLERFEYNARVPITELKQQTEDADLKFLADYVYRKVFEEYTDKQWGDSLDEAGKRAVTSRAPILISCDERYFQDKYQGIPLCGYTELVRRMLDHPNIELRLGVFYCDVTEEWERLFYTGSIDEFFDYRYGRLPYRSVRLDLETHNVPFYQSNAVVNYPCNYDFTRIHEYKYYLNEQSEKTVIAKEYPEEYIPGVNERFYPVNCAKSLELYAKYAQAAQTLSNVHFFGRLGSYRYYDMDAAIAKALELYNSLQK